MVKFNQIKLNLNEESLATTWILAHAHLPNLFEPFMCLKNVCCKKNYKQAILHLNRSF